MNKNSKVCQQQEMIDMKILSLNDFMSGLIKMALARPVGG